LHKSSQNKLKRPTISYSKPSIAISQKLLFGLLNERIMVGFKWL
jgi:hypothetical protein